MVLKIELLIVIIICIVVTIVSCNDLEIKRQDIKTILKNKYQIDMDGSNSKICIKRNFESLVLIELLKDDEALSIISDYEGFIQVKKQNLKCSDVSIQIYTLKRKSDIQAQLANEIIAKYLPIDSDALGDYITDKTSKIGKVVGETFEINNNIDRLLDMAVECTNNIEEKESIKKQKDCGTRVVIGY